MQQGERKHIWQQKSPQITGHDPNARIKVYCFTTLYNVKKISGPYLSFYKYQFLSHSYV